MVYHGKRTISKGFAVHHIFTSFFTGSSLPAGSVLQLASATAGYTGFAVTVPRGHESRMAFPSLENATLMWVRNRPYPL